MVIAAAAASPETTGPCRNTPREENCHAMRPDSIAAAMFPARDHAALRPIRAVSTSRVHRPTVRAATAGWTRHYHLHRSMGQQHRPKARENGDHDGTSRQYQQATLHRDTLAIGTIEPRANRCLRHQAEPSAHCADQPGQGRAPAVLCGQENNEIGAEPTAHVSEQEVQPVERWGAEVLRPEPFAYVTAALSCGLKAATKPCLTPGGGGFSAACHFERCGRTLGRQNVS